MASPCYSTASEILLEALAIPVRCLSLTGFGGHFVGAAACFRSDGGIHFLHCVHGNSRSAFLWLVESTKGPMIVVALCVVSSPRRALNHVLTPEWERAVLLQQLGKVSEGLHGLPCCPFGRRRTSSEDSFSTFQAYLEFPAEVLLRATKPAEAKPHLKEAIEIAEELPDVSRQLFVFNSVDGFLVSSVLWCLRRLAAAHAFLLRLDFALKAFDVALWRGVQLQHGQVELH